MEFQAKVQLVETRGERGDKLRPPTWIEIQLLGEDDQPLGDVAYRLELPGGKLLEGRLDPSGRIRVDAIPTGLCKISFPELDGEAWETLAAS